MTDVLGGAEGANDSRVTETPLMHFLPRQTVGRLDKEAASPYLFIGHSQTYKHRLYGELKICPRPTVYITDL